MTDTRNVRQIESPLGDRRLEEELIGEMMADPKAASVATKAGLRQEHFESTDFATIAAAAFSALEISGSCGVFAVMAQLQDGGELERVGGVERLRQLADRSYPACIKDVTKRVMELSNRRRCAAIGSELLSEVKGGVDSSSAASDAMRRIACVGGRMAQEEDAAKLAKERCQWAQDVLDGKAEDRSIYLDFYDVDAILRGIRRGSFVPLAGFTSVGKTALALNIARKLCGQGLNVTYFTLELTCPELAERLVSTESGVDYNSVIHPAQLTEPETQDMARGISILTSLPGKLNFVHSPSMSTLDVWTNLSASKHAATPVDLAIIDYLQIARPGEKRKFHSREQEVSVIAEETRRMAKSLDCVILALCQLNDAVSGRKTPKATISDIRESKAIGKHADITIMIYYPTWEEAKKTRAVMTIDVVKHNCGSTGECSLLFDKSRQKFVNHTREEVPSWMTEDF